ncbi:B12-binding domain-containing radical SAM protein [Enhygromyxa salina]|uniref:B12 binding domain protein n=1 Tax=Enhygromyxa salina TaxID=215803 RepID=A0A2S9YDB7_9BACT|nr:radical SAM protein [Enhygromyxa salina]PRQ03110.1 B12 binding domain protein [Enhygromyxa salina]
MDVVLLTSILSNTNRLYRPWGPYQLAWYLREHGYQVQVLDFLHKFEKSKILELVSKFIGPETKIVGWNCMFMPGDEKWWIKLICEEIVPVLRRRFPHVNFVTGGAAVHQVNRLYRNRRVFDYLFYGHAEDTLLAFCEHVYRGKTLPDTEIVLGNKVIRETVPLPHLRKRFKIEECAHIWHERDCIVPGESLPIEMARGCIFKCKFCRYPYIGKSKNDFGRRIEFVRDEIIQNHERFGTHNYYMLEDTFNDSNDKVNAFAEMSQKLPFRIGFAAYLRPDLIWSFPGQAEQLRAAGLVSGFLGVESLGEQSSRLIGKAWSGQHARAWLPKLYHDIWQGQVTFRTSLIIGIPPDTREDLYATHQWAVDNGLPNWKWHVLNVNRDHQSGWISEFDKNADSYGFDWYTEYGKTRWKTAVMTWRDAKNLQAELETLGKPHQMQDCWGLIERGTFGYDLAEDKHLLIVKMDRKDAATRRGQFLDAYYDRVMALPA